MNVDKKSILIKIKKKNLIINTNLGQVIIISFFTRIGNNAYPSIKFSGHRGIVISKLSTYKYVTCKC